MISDKILEEVVKETINEVVYVSDLQNHGRGHRAKLSYSKNNRIPRNGQKKKGERIETDKMDNNSHDTYEVPLKNGYVSYNITSITGEDIMHFFKNFFNGKNETSTNIDGIDYKIYMDDNEFNDFMETFINKIKNVILYHAKKYGVKGKINTVCVYPVPSSSNFNKIIANTISNFNVFGKPIIEINQDFLKKDLSNIERDEEFISKNKNFYNKQVDNKLANGKTINSFVDSAYERLLSVNKSQKQVEELNTLSKKIHVAFNNLVQVMKTRGLTHFEDRTNKIVDMFCRYYDLYFTILKSTRFNNTITDKEQTVQGSKLLKDVDGSRNVYTFKNAFYNMLTNKLLERGNSPVTGRPYCQRGPLHGLRGEITDLQIMNLKLDMYPSNLKITNWETVPFEMKKLANPQRIGLKNMFSVTNNEKLLKTETEKLKNTILIIFDDNISGGATLSDICYQFNKIGVKNIIPITFGKMPEKTTFGCINFGSIKKDNSKN